MDADEQRGLYRMRIYCLGMSRTGTTTFTDYLANYGLNVIHYPSQMQLMGGAGDGASDIPVIPVYKDLDKMFRDAKFVYLTRENWVDAVEPYFLRKTGRNYGSATTVLREQVYGSVLWDRQKYGDAYKRHDYDVREYFMGRDNFLEMDLVGGESPQRLNDFLGLPDWGLDFPKSNSREKTWNK